MGDRLLDFLSQFWTWLRPYELILEYEGGVILRFGKYHKTITPGLWWKWPLAEYAITCHTAITTLRLPSQTLTTKDSHQIGVSSIIKYKIESPKQYLLEIWNSGDVLVDVTMGAIKTVVNEQTLEDLIHENTEELILKEVRKECNRYGFRIHKITFTDMGRIKTLRLMTNETAQDD